MIDRRLYEYWVTVKDYHQAPSHHKSGIFHGRIPTVIKHSPSELTRGLLRKFLDSERLKFKIKAV